MIDSVFFTQPLSTLIFTAAIAVFGLIVARKTRMPAILYLLVFGAMMGPSVLDLIRPAIFRHNFPHYISLMVALILFEGAASLKLDQFKHISKPLRGLLGPGVLVTLVIATLAALAVTSLDLKKAILFGAIMIVTGPTVVIPILQRIRLKENLHNLLKWESILIDPLGVIIAVVLFELLVSAHTDVFHTMIGFFARFALGAVVGFGAGWFMYFALTKKWLLRFESEELGGLFLLGVVLLSFGLSEWFYSESGLVTVTIAGLVIGSKRFPLKDKIFHFRDQVTLFALSALFVLLASNVPLESIQANFVPGMLLLGCMIFIVRPASVFLSTSGNSGLARNEKLFLAFFAPKGIVSASMASLFAIAFEDKAFYGSSVFLPLTFHVIAGSILFYGFSAPLFCKWLSVQEKERKAVLMVGASALSLAVGRLLKDRGISVYFLDSNAYRVRQAFKQSQEVFLGSGFDEEFIESLDLKGVDKMIAMTTNHEVNVLSCQVFSRLLGRTQVFRLWGKEDTLEKVLGQAFDESSGRPIYLLSGTSGFDLEDKVEEGECVVTVRKLVNSLKITSKDLELEKIPFPILAVKDQRIYPCIVNAVLPKDSELIYASEALSQAPGISS